jgi:hypothetical protein
VEAPSHRVTVRSSGTRTVAEVGVGETVTVLEAHAGEAVQADVS